MKPVDVSRLNRGRKMLERDRDCSAEPELDGPHQDSEVPACIEAARQVRRQDVTTTADGNPTLIKGVAKDRRISIEEAEMRHGRKSRNVRVDGYKRHVCRDLDSELIVAVGLTPANAAIRLGLDSSKYRTSLGKPDDEN